MIEYIPVTIIPQYNQVLHTRDLLEDIAQSVQMDCREEPGQVKSLICRIAKNKLQMLGKLRDYVDLIGVKSLEATVLDHEYKTITSQELAAGAGVDDTLALRLYSPTAVRHPGKMSSKSQSDATYPWIIPRHEEPVKGEDPVALLLQYIKPNGQTSSHYHNQTIEFFLSLVGKTLLGFRKLAHTTTLTKNIGHTVFTKMMPQTAHQLRTQDQLAINVLCMKPYDPNLKDHIYKNIFLDEVYSNGSPK